ncbi:MAG: FKBP-type peptidyl-prolyl cis-trans isomerase FklB [Pseudoalteromonas tetraodonis]|jgi:FKBP-type peptidyl-prolyl cis-trans isomerase FklB|uniref:Peptidyl-prolyl cis-trans isomerase n=6 Tax=Pseudoalteromonas TaxID=53246 RepID=A0A9W4R432_PSEHA|nr:MULTISPECIES: FKBP-type peptidyl-prolyl cis-trans isomerase [Pseudoalteromonas]MDC2855353.1 FKBP-type peptidyl-prolyl cis-trans isomerase [Ningiella sp. W23]ADT68384.1 FKBP-type 22KD peptidyl-prolyl cis-trans isomerase (rotamase) [Pseudoalteromonas sp. SM9913]ALQ54710.1 Peptidyl-prolyl cis-trans isomerase [Pseudoalteromonas issachenkonii]ATC90519.1 FKBP-type peptidyl-prolyl cis-trans isomerase FklB [Pseudoalteromonas issachenkonii]ATD03099.1 FKBP-type peptidyl-prolyl cis-trans isomerase Fkl|tara:strand:+ start:2525 stop:3142 length:618 start_codon:yes stop_codon:yes gene_type:complete
MSDNFTTDAEKASYGIGLQMGEQLKANPFEGLNLNSVFEGMKDAYAGSAFQVEIPEIQAAFEKINEEIQARREEEAKVLAAEGIAFLEENAKRPEITVTESGLQYEVLATGEGEKPTAESTVRVDYHGTLVNGTVFDSSYERGQPAEFPVGGVIKGWTEALQMMPVGTKWRLYVPHELAYGERGAGAAIAPYSTLVFDVELHAIL